MFVTHGGMGSVLEAAATAVPLVLVGIFSDQKRMGATLASHGSGIALEKSRLGETGYLEKAVKKILHDPR